MSTLTKTGFKASIESALDYHLTGRWGYEVCIADYKDTWVAMLLVEDREVKFFSIPKKYNNLWEYKVKRVVKETLLSMRLLP